jgi:hypothetical protein
MSSQCMPRRRAFLGNAANCYPAALPSLGSIENPSGRDQIFPFAAPG